MAAARRKQITALIESDPVFDRSDAPFLNHTQKYLRSAEKCAAFHAKCEALGLSDKSDLDWAYEAVNDILPTDVHMAMFIPALEHQTNDAQRAEWLPLAKSFHILGVSGIMPASCLTLQCCPGPSRTRVTLLPRGCCALSAGLRADGTGSRVKRERSGDDGDL